MDQYGFKGSFFVVCDWIEKDTDASRMTWQQIRGLHNEGHDIQPKSMTHERLTEISAVEIEYEVGKPKECLERQGINASVFGTPYGEGGDNATVIDAIARHYDFAITGFSDLMFLECNGWKDSSEEDDCRTYYDNGALTPVNRYSIRESSHDSMDRKYLGYAETIFQDFVSVVNSQVEYNDINGTKGNIRAVPILAYHEFGIGGPELGVTDVRLFEREMKYLYDNGFRVITMADLAYDEDIYHLYIRDLL